MVRDYLLLKYIFYTVPGGPGSLQIINVLIIALQKSSFVLGFQFLQDIFSVINVTVKINKFSVWAGFRYAGFEKHSQVNQGYHKFYSDL